MSVKQRDDIAENQVSADSTQDDVEEDEELATDEETDEDMLEFYGYNTWPTDVSIDFSEALAWATVRSFSVDFAGAVEEFRAVQAEFLPRLADDESNVVELRRQILERTLCAAYEKNPSFEACQKLWNELVHLGFRRIERKCNMTWFYAACCRDHGEVDFGLGVLDPLIAEFEQSIAALAASKGGAMYYREEVVKLQELRAELVALRP